MTRIRRKTVTVLSAICLASGVISTGCVVEDAADSAWEAATECPEYDPYGTNNCLNRVCGTDKETSKYYRDCDALREAKRNRTDNQTEGN